MLRNSPIGAYVYPVVPSEYSNWRDEQKAWRETAVLFDQSHHMANLYVEGPDALKLLSYLGTNSFANFPVNRAKQFAPCNYDGYVIGDGILFHLAQDSLVYVGRAPVANWLEFHATSGNYDVKIKRDDRSPSNPGGKAGDPDDLPVPDSGTERQADYREAERRAVSRRSSSSTWARSRSREEPCARCVTEWPALRVSKSGDRTKSGRKSAPRSWRRATEFGMKQVGSRAYASNTCESGWIPSPLPAVYTGEKMKSYRQWLPANGYEATGSLAGSFVSNNIEDYYNTPYELGYGIFVKFDHDFIGREALEKIDAKPQRKKVTFAWNGEDVPKSYKSLLEPGDPYKFIDLPISNYASSSYDKIVTKGGKIVGALDVRRLQLQRAVRAVARRGGSGRRNRHRAHAGLGRGERRHEEGDRRTPQAARSERAIVSPVPYSKVVRETYAEGLAHGA